MNNYFENGTSADIKPISINGGFEELIKLYKELEEKYPKKDRIDFILYTYKDKIIEPNDIFKAEYNNKNYILMNICELAKLINLGQQERDKEREFENPYLQKSYLPYGIPVINDDELIIKILKKDVDNWAFNYERNFIVGNMFRYKF